MCNHEYGVLVASGVDERGEWQSWECIDCGQIRLERSNGVEINGYIIGDEPTDEEHAIFRKVKAYNDRLDVALALETIEKYEGVKLTQDEFETVCHRVSRLDWNDDFMNAVEWEFDDIIEERNEQC